MIFAPCNQAKFMKMKFVFGHSYSSFFSFPRKIYQSFLAYFLV